MANRVQRVRDTETGTDQFVGLSGEMTVDTTNRDIRVHDGATPGGTPSARRDLTTSPDATVSSAGRMSTAQVAQLNDHETRLDTLDTVTIPGIESDVSDNSDAIADLEAGGGQLIVSSGGPVAYVVTPSPAPSALDPGYTVVWQPNQANVDFPTLEVTGFPTAPLVTRNGTPLFEGMLQTANVVTSVYDGTNFVVEALSVGYVDPGFLAGPGLVLRLDDDSAATGPDINIYRRRSSQGDNSDIGQLRFLALDSGGGLNSYARIKARVIDATVGTEDAALSFFITAAATEVERLLLDDNEVKVVGVDFNIDTGDLNVQAGDAVIAGNCIVTGDIVVDVANDVRLVTGTGTPEGSVAAGVGSIYMRQDPGSDPGDEDKVQYVKFSGTGTAGWKQQVSNP